ncbi:MAG: Ser-Thr-rich GPI-anchored membrane family protein [Thermodesulfovibrionales bacterium]|jgi:FtsP/CotA-like multicopper oxidase with cupredoxin domain
MVKHLIIKSLKQILVTALFLMGIVSVSSALTVNLQSGVVKKTMPDGKVVRMWGFGRVGGAITVPGPVITVPPGDTTLTINLTNNLLVPVSVVIPGQAAALQPVWVDSLNNLTGLGARPNGDVTSRVRSFTQETAPGATTTYTWTNLKPGTYLYQSGTDPAVQVQMGLYGALRQNTAVNQAYTDASTQFNKELVLLYSEIHSQLHDAVALGQYGPGTAMPSAIHYDPEYFLVNGTPFSYGKSPVPTPPINPGEKVLLRFLNAGLMDHVPVLQGPVMRGIAEDGNPMANQLRQYSLYLQPGKTKDVLIAPAKAGYYGIYDRRLIGLTNKKQAPGGLLTYLKVASVTQHALNVGKAGTGSGSVAVNSAPGGIDCGTNCSETYNAGTIISLIATPDFGSKFIGWSGSVSGIDPTITVIMDSAKNVTANFVPASPMRVVQPNGGEIVLKGSVQTISWEYNGNPGSYVRIELLRNGSVYTIIANQVPIGSNGVGSFAWTVPPQIPSVGQYTVRVISTSNNNYKDVSDNPFAVQ